MKVLFYTDLSISPMTGGIGRVTSVLTEYFREQFGWRVYSFYAAEAAEDCARTDVDGAISLRLHDRLGIRLNVWRNYSKAVDYIESKGVDVVIVQTSVDVVAKLRERLDARGLNRVKIVFCLHYFPGADIRKVAGQKGLLHGLPGMVKRLFAPLYDALIEKATVRHYQKAYQAADRTLVLSQSYVDEYVRFAGLKSSDRISVMYNPLSFDEKECVADIDLKKNTVLIVGRLDEAQKCISLAINLWSKIENDFPEWSFDIVGDGPSYAQYEGQIKKEGIKRCYLLGRQDPIFFYKRCSLFLMTSSSEGFPMTILEAQQFGCVPIVFDSFSAVSDMVNDGVNGIVIENNDIDAFRVAICRLMNDIDMRNALAKQAMQSCKKFSKDRICSEWYKLLTKICNDRQ